MLFSLSLFKLIGTFKMNFWLIYQDCGTGKFEDGSGSDILPDYRSGSGSGTGSGSYKCTPVYVYMYEYVHVYVYIFGNEYVYIYLNTYLYSSYAYTH